VRGPALFHPGRAPTTGAAAMGETRTRLQRVTAMAGRMSEAELESGVRRILKDLERAGHKVLASHPWSSVHSASGFPDWCFCGSGGVAWRELKRAGKEPTGSQREWLDALTAAGMSAGVWYPADLLDGTIARELAALAGIGGSG